MHRLLRAWVSRLKRRLLGPEHPSHELGYLRWQVEELSRRVRSVEARGGFQDTEQLPPR